MRKFPRGLAYDLAWERRSLRWFRFVYQGRIRPGDYGWSETAGIWIELRACYRGVNIRDLEFKIARKKT